MRSDCRTVRCRRAPRFVLVGLLACSLGLTIGGCSLLGGDEESSPPPAPSELTGESGDGQVALDWDAAAGAETYRVYRATRSMAEAEGSPLETGVAEASYVDGSAENGTKYYYRVTSVSGEGAESGPSNEVSKTPFSDPPPRP